MSEFQPFADSRLKIERAEKHINDLNAELRAFEKTGFHRLIIEREPDSHRHRFHVEFIEPNPTRDFALIIGDALHNTRSALDLMISQMIREKLGPDTRTKAKFPFYETRETLIGCTSGGHIQKAGANVLDLIWNRVRPYKTGDKDLPGPGDLLLYALHDLDIEDKHFLLIPNVSLYGVRDIELEDESGRRFGMSITFRDNISGVHVIDTDTQLHVKKNGQAAIHIFFGKGLPVENNPVVPTLLQFVQRVARTIDIFEEL